MPVEEIVLDKLSPVSPQKLHSSTNCDPYLHCGVQGLISVETS